MRQDLQNANALTQKGDWFRYYSGRELDEIAAAAADDPIIDEYLKGRIGKIFELGCGGSHILARSAIRGWEVGGIDFNAEALGLLRTYLDSRDFHKYNLVCGDVLFFDCAQIGAQYDLLVSFGFLEHFKDPREILEKWKVILKPGGMVFSMIPNLFSINAPLLRKFDPEFWAQHVRYSPRDMDEFHLKAGLIPVKQAGYAGKYDVHMLIPWPKIEQSIGNRPIFKVVKYFASYGVETVLGLLPRSDLRLFNPRVVGVYTLPHAPSYSRS